MIDLGVAVFVQTVRFALLSLRVALYDVTSWMTLTCTITEVSPRSGGAASIECWRAIFSTSCYPHIVPMMNRWLVKRFVLHLYIFHLYLIINKNTEKGMYLVIQERFSSNIWYVTIFCEYPVSLKLLLNILYPNNFFLKYPVSRQFFPRISRIPKTPNGASMVFRPYPRRQESLNVWTCFYKGSIFLSVI